MTSKVNQEVTQDDYDFRHREVTLKEKVEERFQRLLLREKFKFDREMFEEVDQGDINVSTPPNIFYFYLQLLMMNS